MIKSILFKAFPITFILFLLLNFGDCVVTQEDLSQIRNELDAPDSINVVSSRLYDIIKKDDANEIRAVREMVNERLRSDDMIIKQNTLRSCYLIHNKLRNSEECVTALIEILKDDRYRESHYGMVKFMGLFPFNENHVKELLEMSPEIEKRLGYQYWELFISSIASSGGEKAYDLLIKHYNLDNATTETLSKHDWLLIKTGDMRSVKRVMMKLENMEMDTLRYSRELGSVVGKIIRKARKDNTEENMRLYNRCLKLMDKITNNESSHPRYVQIVCMVLSGMLLNPEERQFALSKLEELRPVWEDTYYAKDIEFQIKKAVREEGRKNK